jgi:hypothetical protein
VRLTGVGVEDARHGRPISAAGLAEPPPTLDPEMVCALLDPTGRMVALAERCGGQLKIRRGFVL